MENPVNQFGYLSSTAILIVMWHCVAMPCAVGSALGQNSELLQVLRSYDNAK